MNDDELLLVIDDGSWPSELWSHRAHVRIAYLHLCRLELKQAIDRMRSSIKAFHAVRGVKDGPQARIMR